MCPSDAMRDRATSPPDDDTLLAAPGSRLAHATALYRDQSLSLGQAARRAGLLISSCIQHVSQLGIPVVRGTMASAQEDTKTIEAWRKESSCPPAAR